jgi:hypothetical protein
MLKGLRDHTLGLPTPRSRLINRFCFTDSQLGDDAGCPSVGRRKGEKLFTVAVFMTPFLPKTIKRSNRNGELEL